jgi:acyl-CoA thioesterase I
MKYLLAFLCLLGLYALYSYGRIAWAVRQERNPKLTQMDKTFGQGQSLKYMAAGDSTAFGEGASVIEKTYAYRVAEHLSQTNQVSYKNIAVVGSTTASLIENQIPQIIAYQPDVVTISIGANDRTHLASNNAILKNFQTIIQTLQEKTQAKIYITDIPNFNGAELLPAAYIAWLEHQSKTLNPKIKQLENDRVKIVDIHDFGWSQFPDMSVTYAADNFHPNDLGYDNWTNAFLSKIGQ